MQHPIPRGQTLFLVLAAIVLVMAVPRHHAAARDIETDVLGTKAWAALERGDHTAAAQLFELAYARRPQSSFLYGLARAHDQYGDVQAAYELYRMYLVSLDTEPAKHRLALNRLNELAPLVRLLTRTPTIDVAEYSAPALRPQWQKCPCPDLQNTRSLTSNKSPPPPVSEEPPHRRFQPLTIAAISLGAAGAGAIAAGSGLARLARSEQLAFSRSLDEDFKRRARTRIQALTSGSIASYVTGSVLALASVTWLPFLLRPIRRATRRDISLVPWLSPQTLGGEVSWTF